MSNPYRAAAAARAAFHHDVEAAVYHRLHRYAIALKALGYYQYVTDEFRDIAEGYEYIDGFVGERLECWNGWGVKRAAAAVFRDILLETGVYTFLHPDHNTNLDRNWSLETCPIAGATWDSEFEF